jgi:hypothetical protein
VEADPGIGDLLCDSLLESAHIISARFPFFVFVTARARLE